MEAGTLQVRNKKDLLWIALFEFLGTAIFLLGIQYTNQLSVAPSPLNPCPSPNGSSAASIVGTSIFIAAILTGRVGGGHFNMAVTTAVYIMEYKNWR